VHASWIYVVHSGARLWCYRRNNATTTERAVSQPSCTLSVPFLHASERNLSGRLGSWKLMSENGNWLSKNHVPTYANIFKRHVPLTTCNQSPTRPESKKHGGFNMSQGISSHFKPFLLLDFGVKLRCSSIWISWASRHWQSLQRSPPNRAPEVNASRRCKKQGENPQFFRNYASSLRLLEGSGGLKVESHLFFAVKNIFMLILDIADHCNNHCNNQQGT
jgi:hypothetical protein